jgi:HK97 family phage major capsid protein
MMHDLVLKEVRKLKDEDKRPLWEPSLQAGAPSSLLGSPVVVNNDMASSVATGAKTVLFGNLAAAYVWRTVSGGQLVRLDERYADFLQVGFFGFSRADGLVQDTAAIKLLVQP